MKNIYPILICLIFSFSCQKGVKEESQPIMKIQPRAILDSVIAKMGGLDKWNNINSLKISHIGHKNWIEQSENPNGPFITSYEEISDEHNVHDSLIKVSATIKHFQFPNPSKSEVLISGSYGVMLFGENQFPMPKSYMEEFYFLNSIYPEQILLNALDKKIIREKDSIIDGVNHFVLNYNNKKEDIKLYINTNTYLISEATFTRKYNDDPFFSMWGNLTSVIKYSLYNLYDGGIRYPLQYDIYRKDKKWRSFSINKIDFNKEKIDTVYTIPENIKEQLDKPKPNYVDQEPLSSIEQIEENLYKIKGSWDVFIIDTKDGIIIIETPISEEYSFKIVKEIKNKFPNKKILYAINTSEAWPHIAGITGYLRQGISVYTHKLNKEIIGELLTAKNLEKSNNNNLKFVSIPIELANENVKIFPFSGEGSARMLGVYIQENKILYASDLVQRMPNGNYFFPQYLDEITSAVEKLNIDVDKVFALHSGILDYLSIQEYLLKKYLNNYNQ